LPAFTKMFVKFNVTVMIFVSRPGAGHKNASTTIWESPNHVWKDFEGVVFLKFCVLCTQFIKRVIKCPKLSLEGTMLTDLRLGDANLV